MGYNPYIEIGKRIRSIRETKGFSQEELATQLGYKSVATISHFETGSRKISVSDLLKIAQIMSVPIDYLTGEIQQRVTPSIRERLSFRAKNIVPSIRNHLEPFLQFAEQNAQMPELITHEIDKDSSGGIGRLAKKYLDTLNILEPPVSPRQITQELNIPVFDWSFPPDVSGLTFFNNNFVCIGVNDQHPYVRQQFTIAHELGHVVLHSDDNDSADLFIDVEFNDMEVGQMWTEQDNQQREKEREANWFAADLLMPKDWLVKDFEVYGEDGLLQMTRRYGVSEQALWIRLVRLKLVERNSW